MNLYFLEFHYPNPWAAPQETATSNNNRHILSAWIRRGQEAAAKLPTECITVIASQGKMPSALPHPRRPPGLPPHPTLPVDHRLAPAVDRGWWCSSAFAVTEICSLSSMEAGSVHEVQVERESLSRAQGTRLGAWSLGTHVAKVEPHVSRVSIPSVHVPSSCLTYLTKHRFKHKIWAFGILLSGGLYVVGLSLVAHLQSCPWLIAVHVVARSVGLGWSSLDPYPIPPSVAMWLLPGHLTTLCPSFIICKKCYYENSTYKMN